MNTEVKVTNNEEHRKTHLGALCDELRLTGYSSVSNNLIVGNSTPADWTDLSRDCRMMPNDPYAKRDGAGNPRSLGSFIVLPSGEVIPLPGIELPHADNIQVSPFAIGDANPLVPNDRMFPIPSTRIQNNPAVLEMVRAAVAMDPVAATASKRMPFICQVFFQGSEVNLQHPDAPAAPPPHAHKDNCRFKLVVLIDRHNVTGGESAILPVKRIRQTTTEGALMHINLKKPGEGYAFLDEKPGADETREDNVHIAVDLALGNQCDTGYRYVATLTTAPLIIGRGDSSELKAGEIHSRSVVWPWIHGGEMVNKKTPAEVAEWLGNLARPA